VGLAATTLICLLDWKRALLATALVALAGLLVVVIARRRLGGATGDVCGATAELCQVAALIAFAAS
jgi:adenosylcobinamide-GDP ribazoletransferase